jgi:hypothetical protein
LFCPDPAGGNSAFAVLHEDEAELQETEALEMKRNPPFWEV